jgi:tetratricopeptide (TPR) repeat protein
MILRLSNTVSRGVLVFLAFSAAAILSFFSIRAALASHAIGLGTQDGFERATRLEPGNARNWYFLGRYWQYNMEQSDPQRAIRAYRVSLSIDPHSADTLQELGTTYELEGDLPSARDAFLRAKQAYPASADVSWRYGNFLLRQGELQPAFAEIRRAVAADPKRSAEAFSRCYRANPDIDFILDQVLPASQEGYVDVIWDLTADHQTALAMKVWAKLVTLHPHLAMRDVYSMVGSLLEKKEYSEARRVWDEGVSFTDFSPLPLPQLASSVLWDGSFEAGLNGYYFAWQFSPLWEGVQASFDSKEKHSGNRSLRISFDGKHNVNFENVCARAVVQPGTSYLFSAWIQTKALKTNQGVGFRLRAPENPGSPLVKTSEIHGSEPWTRIEAPWTAGSNVQLVQICASRDPNDGEESRIQGTAWIDDVALTPLSVERSKP